MEFTFAELLRSYRERASLSRADLTAALNIHRNTLSGWECGQHRPQDAEQMLRLAEELALSPAETDQLLHAAGLPAAHGTPAPRPVRHQLRPPIADFVGRSAEVAQLVHAFQTAVTQGRGAVISSVQGMGGIGKTELAYLVAQHLLTTFPDAQIVVPLRGTSPQPLSPEQALRSVIYAFTPEAKLPDDLAALQAHYHSVLHKKRVFILADDAADAAQVRLLIPPPGCALLITSRQRFSLPGMRSFELPVLDDPDAVTLLSTLCDRLSTAEALALTRACGSLPLALRISGSLLHNDTALSISTYLAQLADRRRRLALLRDPDDPTLDAAATLALSYAQLDVESQAVFRQLGVFVADCEASLAQAVVTASSRVEVDETLRLLLRRNLVMYDTARSRWRLHDLLRDLARGYLEERGEWEALMWRYAQASVQLSETLRSQYLAGGEDAPPALARFDAERVHVEAAWQWALAHTATPEGDRLLLNCLNATYCLSTLRDDVRHERIPRLLAVLAAARRLDNRATACQTLNRLGIAEQALGQPRQAIHYYNQALPLAQALDDQRTQGMVLNNLGLAHQNLGEAQRARTYYQQRLALAHSIGDRRGICITLGNLGLAEAECGEGAQAIETYERALTQTRTLGDRLNESITLSNLGLAYGTAGAVDQAQACCTQALTLARALGSRQQEAAALSALACITVTSAVEATWPLFAAACDGFRAVADRWGEAECQWHWGLALLQQGERVQALPHLRACIAYQREIGHAQLEAHIAELHALTGEAFESSEW